MSDKLEFSFDDNDDFPETDLSRAFSDAEQAAPEPEPESEPLQGAAPDEEAAPKKRGLGRKKRRRAEKDRDAGGRSTGGSRSRVLLLILLLIVAAAGGGYYFMGLGESTPAPKAPPAQKTTQTVSLPPKPSKAIPAPMPAAEPATEQEKMTITVPPPLPPGEAQQELAAPPVAEETAAAAAPPAAEKMPAPVVEAKGAAAEVAKPPQEGSAAEVPAPLTAASGPYLLDAGSYLMKSNRDALVKKIEALGYAPQVTPVEATLAMTRLRLGSFPASEVEEALAFARTIEPESFSVREGEGHVIYAGTYLLSGTVEKLRGRFLQEGIRAEAVPVKVVRTLSRIRFGGFASKAEAESAAAAATSAGLQVQVVKGR